MFSGIFLKFNKRATSWGLASLASRILVVVADLASQEVSFDNVCISYMVVPKTQF